MHFDAISYGAPALRSLIDQVGEDRIMFGTDNPFFPPAEGDVNVKWPSAVKVLDTIEELKSASLQLKIMSQNAERILGV